MKAASFASLKIPIVLDGDDEDDDTQQHQERR